MGVRFAHILGVSPLLGDRCVLLTFSLPSCGYMCSGVNENIKYFNRLANPIDDKNTSDVIPQLTYVANTLNGYVAVRERAQFQNMIVR